MPLFEGAISNLKTGEYSNVLKTRDKYYIVKLIDRKEAPVEELERVRGSIEKAIRKRKERERSDEYLKYLRERSRVKVDSKLLSNIRLDGEKEEKENLSKDARVIAEVNGSILTVKDFIYLVTPAPTRSKEEILDNWIDLKLIDLEALNRHYEKKSDLKDMVHRYKNQLLKNTFNKKIIVPQIIISEKTLEEYYASHQERFTKPIRFKIQQITVKTMDEAREILDNLQKGADFSWLAEKRSFDSANEKGGDIGWLTETQMPKPVREIIDTLNTGDISRIIKIDSNYRIIRLQDKKEGGIEEFNKVKNLVSKAYFEEQLNTTFNTYVAELKKDAEISINNVAVQSLGKGLQK
jgi:parvulin-like peptidyl-prolyl isomerase